MCMCVCVYARASVYRFIHLAVINQFHHTHALTCTLSLSHVRALCLHPHPHQQGPRHYGWKKTTSKKSRIFPTCSF